MSDKERIALIVVIFLAAVSALWMLHKPKGPKKVSMQEGPVYVMPQGPQPMQKFQVPPLGAQRVDPTFSNRDPRVGPEESPRSPIENAVVMGAVSAPLSTYVRGRDENIMTFQSPSILQ